MLYSSAQVTHGREKMIDAYKDFVNKHVMIGENLDIYKMFHSPATGKGSRQTQSVNPILR